MPSLPYLGRFVNVYVHLPVLTSGFTVILSIDTPFWRSSIPMESGSLLLSIGFPSLSFHTFSPEKSVVPDLRLFVMLLPSYFASYGEVSASSSFTVYVYTLPSASVFGRFLYSYVHGLPSIFHVGSTPFTSFLSPPLIFL